MSEGRRLVTLANARLKAGKIGVTLVVQGKGDWLYLRGTFPPRPGDRRIAPYQTRIALGMKALERKAVDKAELIAKEVGLDLNRGAFDWRKFSDFEDPTRKTAGSWATEWEKKWWATRDRSDQSAQNTWRIYRGCLNSLPQEADLTLELLTNWITERSQPGKRMRGHYCLCAKGMAKLAGLPLEPIQELDGGYGLKPVNPRDLPSDEAIANVWAQIEDPGWQYIYGLMAAYGLRNHEVWFLDLADFPMIRVREGTKTGTRPIQPLYPEWAKQWRLDEPIAPNRIKITVEHSNGQLGAKVTKFFEGSAIAFHPYDLRHSYARRCAEFGIAPDIAARLLGHSTLIHEQVYRAWIGDQFFLDAARRATQNPDRPLPP
jgi:integrase